MVKPPSHPPLTPEALAAVAERFRLLSAPSRLRVLDALQDGPLGMGELARVSGLEPSNLSRHVGELERGGCVRRRRAGRSLVVEIADPTLTTLCELVCGALRARLAAEQAALGTP